MGIGDWGLGYGVWGVGGWGAGATKPTTNHKPQPQKKK